MDSVRAGPFGQLFRPDNFVFGQTGFLLRIMQSVFFPPKFAFWIASLSPKWDDTCVLQSSRMVLSDWGVKDWIQCDVKLLAGAGNNWAKARSLLKLLHRMAKVTCMFVLWIQTYCKRTERILKEWKAQFVVEKHWKTMNNLSGSLHRRCWVDWLSTWCCPKRSRGMRLMLALNSIIAIAILSNSCCKCFFFKLVS